MPARPTWKGFLRLSLVTVPVKAYTATSSGNEVRLNQLHKSCNNRIKYQKSCPEHGPVPTDEIVSGYEFSKGQYVVVDLEELSKLRPESDRTVRIDGFVDHDAVDPLYLSGRTYYLVPDGAVGQKPYTLMARAMVEDEVHVIGQVVIAGREQLVLIKPIDGVLTMCVLYQENRVTLPHEVRDEVSDEPVSADELGLTKTLIGASKLREFDHARYDDVYQTRLQKLIQAKVAGDELVQVADPEEPVILNLMEALQQSVAAARLAEG